jgi:nitrate reductase cytochrome c-type subunit
MKKSLSVSVLLVPCLAFATSVVADNNLADRHARKGLKCAQCHVEKVPSEAPKMDRCLKCHGGSYEELGKSSAEKQPNPHYTHVGDRECAVCHKGHTAPEFFCNDCHRFKVQLP